MPASPYPPRSFYRLGELVPDTVIFGTSEAMRTVRSDLERVARTNVPVLVRGESGTGKEVIAKYIHARSSLSQGPFVKINCPAIPGTLLESELFGYERGAFTGAYTSKPGLVELAEGGTLFLDEIAELEPSFQVKLLHLLQDGTFSRVGGQEDKKAEVRVICATNRILDREIDAGRFRQDLYYRINVVSIGLPPLRERIADIPILVRYFLDLYEKKYDSRPKPPSAEFMHLLQQHAWPGNIRELENIAKRYVILGSEEVISSELLRFIRRRPSYAVQTNGSTSLKSITRNAVRELERQIILDVLNANNWNRKEAARILKISYRALFYKIKDSGMPQKRSTATVQPDGGNGEENGSRKRQKEV